MNAKDCNQAHFMYPAVVPWALTSKIGSFLAIMLPLITGVQARSSRGLEASAKLEAGLYKTPFHPHCQDQQHAA